MKLLALVALLAITGIASAATPQPLGLTFTRHGVQRPDVSVLFKATPLPASDTTLEVYFYFTNQKTLGACGPFSASECFDAISQQSRGVKCQLSPMDIYQRTTDWPNDAGVSNANLIKTMEAGNVLELSLIHI